ncbi:MAG TPA: DNA alkylation repair protein, partial [Clostridiales bacterium]|nr:DNA alkylation repair protein [Clostridiales bacterium]
AAKCRDVTFAYLVGDGKRVLNVFTYNKALQKMRDSYRISDDDKAATYVLKRSE